MFNARTNGPCITFPHEEHVLAKCKECGEGHGCFEAHEDTETKAVDVFAEEALEDGGGSLSELDEPERADE